MFNRGKAVSSGVVTLNRFTKAYILVHHLIFLQSSNHIYYNKTWLGSFGGRVTLDYNEREMY